MVGCVSGAEGAGSVASAWVQVRGVWDVACDAHSVEGREAADREGGASWSALVRARVRVLVCESSDGVARSDEARPLWGCGPSCFPDRSLWQGEQLAGPPPPHRWWARGTPSPSRPTCRRERGLMPSGRRCPALRCPVIIHSGRYCPAHATEYEARRGSSAARGYGWSHQQERARWQDRIDSGEYITCVTCPARIEGREWDLAHVPGRKDEYLGPQCRRENRSDGGRRGRASQR